MSLNTQALGIHQSDIVIRTAIVAALRDLRANPWLLDFCFASLPFDDLTSKEYGDKQVAKAKEWFLAHDIAVSMSLNVDEAKLPCVTISLSDSSETLNTLGDVHWEAAEWDDSKWPALTEPFYPTSYDPTTGTMTISDAVADTVVVYPGMVVVDALGGAHAIEKVLDLNTFTIETGVITEFAGSRIKGPRPSRIITLESAAFNETYEIGVHVQGEPIFLTYLHSIIMFALLRYRQQYLEDRGFGNSSLKSSAPRKNEAFEAEFVWSRYITISGLVHNYWPKAIKDRISALAGGLQVIDGENLPEGDVDDSLWIGDQDSFGLVLR